MLSEVLVPIDKDSRPRLHRGCRLKISEAGEAMLLIPEGIVQLNASAQLILKECTGQQSLQDICLKLRALHPEEKIEKIEADVGNLLLDLHRQRAIQL